MPAFHKCWGSPHTPGRGRAPCCGGRRDPVTRTGLGGCRLLGSPAALDPRARLCGVLCPQAPGCYKGPARRQCQRTTGLSLPGSGGQNLTSGVSRALLPPEAPAAGVGGSFLLSWLGGSSCSVALGLCVRPLGASSLVSESPHLPGTLVIGSGVHPAQRDLTLTSDTCKDHFHGRPPSGVPGLGQFGETQIHLLQGLLLLPWSPLLPQWLDGWL